MTRLADLTTLRVGGPAGHFADATTDDEIVDEVRRADRDGVPLLVIGGGSNLVVSDEGFPGLVLRVSTRGIERDGAIVRAAAGEDWDAFVAAMVADGRTGIEALAGIPGRIGATPVQNVGAYGQEVAQTLMQVLAFDRHTDKLVSLIAAQCEFTYRGSAFKNNARYVILAVHFALPVSEDGAPVTYPELARRLGIELNATAAPATVRAAVLDLRRAKGMVLDEADHDTWSAGSFFTNPVLSEAQAAELPADAPRYPTPGGVKTSAAWLIERAGFTKGYAAQDSNTRSGGAALSHKHVLAITNRGEATADDVLSLARAVRDGVRDRFGITLVAEPQIVGETL